MRLYLISILIGLMTAIIASNKGYGFLRWWIRGTAFAPFALLYAIFMKRNAAPLSKKSASIPHMPCPHCKEKIEVNAQSCRFCHKKIEIIDI